MKTIFKVSLLLVIPLLIFSCEEEIEDVGPQKHILIFCDLTTSLNSNDIKIQSDKVSQLIDNQNSNFEISIYPMDVSIYQNILFQDSIPPLSQIHQSKNIAIKDKKSKIAADINNILIETYTNHSQSNVDFKSCIISSFEMAYNLLPNDKETLENTQVVFFTDMVEQCPDSALGPLYMCSSTRQPNFEEILKKVEKEYIPKTKLSEKLTNDQVHVVITSSYGNQSRCITESQQNQIWDTIFIKQGFDTPQSIYRKSTVPDLW